MDKIIKNTKVFRENKKLLRQFKSYHNDIISSFMISMKFSDMPPKRCMSIMEVTSNKYIAIYHEIIDLIKQHYISQLDVNVFITTRPMGSIGGCTTKAMSLITNTNTDKFIFTFDDVINNCKYFNSAKDVIDYLYIQNKFKTEEELYEEEKIKEARDKDWEEKMENSLNIKETIAEDGYTILKRYEGNCRCCGTFFSATIDGFAPNCPNCGAQVNLSYFDLIETALSDNPQGTGASTIYRKTLLENR